MKNTLLLQTLKDARKRDSYNYAWGIYGLWETAYKYFHPEWEDRLSVDLVNEKYGKTKTLYWILKFNDAVGFKLSEIKSNFNLK